MSELPNGWAQTSLGEITAATVGQGGPSPHVPDFTYVDISSIDRATKRVVNPQKLATDAAPSRARQRLEPGDVLVSMTRPNLNAVAIITDELAGSIGSTGFHVLRANSVSPNWIYYRVQSEAFISAMSMKVQGALYPAVRPKDIEGFDLNLPPLNEQGRVVDEIDKQFSRLDAATAALNRVQANLKRYRASVLKVACEGRLVPTEAELARKEGREYEPADKLLERILQERRARWEADTLAKMIASGKSPRDDGWKRKYKEPSAPGMAELPPLPIGWCWVALDQLIVSGPQNGLYKPVGSYGAGVPIVRIEDFQNDWHRSSGDLKCLRLNDDERNTYRLQQDDILINRVNSPSHLAKSVAVPTEWSGAVFESNMMRFQVASFISIPWLLSYLYSHEGKSRLTSNAKWAVNQASINQDDVRNTPVPLAPHGEQVRIAERISTLLTQTSRTVEQLSAQLSRASRLRQSVLKAAFCGILLPQDPADEPASLFLERIRAERSAAAPKATARHRKQEPVHA